MQEQVQRILNQEEWPEGPTKFITLYALPIACCRRILVTCWATDASTSTRASNTMNSPLQKRAESMLAKQRRRRAPVLRLQTTGAMQATPSVKTGLLVAAPSASKPTGKPVGTHLIIPMKTAPQKTLSSAKTSSISVSENGSPKVAKDMVAKRTLAKATP